MNKKMKYYMIFVLFSLVLLMASSISAADINETAFNDMAQNAKTDTVSDDMDIPPCDNNTKTIKEETADPNDATIHESRETIENASTTTSKRNTRLVNDKLPISVRLNDVFTISGTLIDEENMTVSDAEVIFIINNERFTNTTDANGHYEYNYMTTSINEDNLYEVRYTGDDNYNLAKNYIGSYFDVEAFKAIITVNATDCGMGDAAIITGTVKKSDKTLITDAEVLIKINDEEYSTVTNEEGIFEYSYKTSHMGTYNVTATAPVFKQASASTTFNVTKSATDIIINPIMTRAEQETHITANITTIDDSFVTGGKVVFKLNGKSIKDENGKIIYANVVNGKATITYTFTNDTILGNITAVYSGSTSFIKSHSKAIQPEIGQAQQDEQPKLTGRATVTLNNITAVPSETITITANIKDGQTNINEGKTTFKIDGKTIKDEKGRVIYVKVVNGTAILQYTIPTTYLAKDHVLKATFKSSKYNKTENQSTLLIVDEKNFTTKTNNTNGQKTSQGNIHIITNENIDEYITADGLTDLVSPQDTLDIQGLIDKEHSLIIDKPVNIISSTKNAVISLHTNAGSYLGEDPGNCFVVNNAGSGSNISNLYLNNTECWMFNNYDVTLYNMTMYVKDARVGSGVGQTAIRYCERITLDSCYIYTQDNGGSTSMAFTGSSDVLVKNTTFQAVGEVGNIIYLANHYNSEDMPSDFVRRDTNFTFIGCTIMGVCDASIRVAIFNTGGTNCTFINNTINTTGTYGGISTWTGGVAIGNKFYQDASLTVTSGTNASENIFYDNSKIIVNKNTNIFNNQIALLDYINEANLTNNTIHDIIMYSNNTLANQTITGNVYLNVKKSASNTVINNAVITNNTIYGNVEIIGYSASKRCTNNSIISNNIGGNITITQGQRNNITNNNINGSIIIASTGYNTVVKNNTIITDNEYAVTTEASANITDNYLISDNYQKINAGAIYDSSGKSNITNNGPETTSASWKVNIHPVYATVGENTVIIVDVVDENSETPITEGEVYLMINDDIVTDEKSSIISAKVSSSQAMLEINSVPTDWLRSDAVLTAVYSNDEIIKTYSINMSINKPEATVEITTDDFNISIGQTITLTAKVTYNDELLNGQLAFKLNACSLENDEGQLICVDVVNGLATLEYTFDENINPATYTLSAVFENQYYIRSSDTKILVIE